MAFTPPTADQLLAIKVNAGIAELAEHERFAAAEPDLVEALVEGNGAFAAGEWAPLSRIGDIEDAKLENGVVRLPDGFAVAYKHYVEQGWNAIAARASRQTAAVTRFMQRSFRRGFRGGFARHYRRRRDAGI